MKDQYCSAENMLANGINIINRIIYTDIIDFDDYQIGNDGSVLNKKSGSIMSPSIDKNGYHKINLWHIVNGRHMRKTFRICRLVAIHFIPNIDNKPTVNHKDGNKINCYDWNLEWCTVSENTQHAYLTGLAHSDIVEQLDMNNNIIKEYVNGYRASDELNIPYNSIRKCCKGMMHYTHGFKFRYKNK